MPLNGAGLAAKPAGTTAVSNTTIESSKFNSVIDDIYNIFNTARPIAYGGTGAATAVGGHDGLTTKGSDVASAATLDLDAATGAFIDITGTTTVTAVTLTSGRQRMARATGAFRLTASSTLVVNGSTSVSYTTSAQDLLLFEGYAGSVVRVWTINTPLYGLTSYPPGTLYGLTLSNNAGTPLTKIDIAVGSCRDGADSANMDLLAALTAKDAGSTWAVGSSAGCLDTGALVNNTWYHGWLIKRPDTGVVDFLLSTSATAPTMPTNYTIKRRIGSPFKTNGSAQFLAFTQTGDDVVWNAVQQDYSSGALGSTAVTVTLTVPPVKCMARIRALASNAGATAIVLISSPDAADVAPNATGGNISMIAATGADTAGEFQTLTSSAGAIRVRATNANTSLLLVTRGYTDTRGRV